LAKVHQDITKGLRAKKPQPGAPYHLSLYRGDIVRVQSNPTHKTPTKAEAAWVCAFSTAAHYSKVPDPRTFDAASQQTSDTGWYYRDAITAGIFGKLYTDVGGLKITTPTTRVTNSAYQALTNGVVKVLNIDAQVWDNNYFWDPVGHPTRLTFRSAGLYMVGCQVAFSGGSATRRDFAINLNGATQIANKIIANTSGGFCQDETETLYYFHPGDYIEFIAFCTTTSVTAKLDHAWVMAITPEQVIP